MYKPKHRKQKMSRARIATAVAVAGAIPMVVAPAANAATMPQWDATAQLESGGDWSINHSYDGMSVGGLQFQNASWHDALNYLASKGYDVSGWTWNLYQWMPRSAVPNKDETVLAAEALLHLQGPGAWANGNFQGDSSMFDGGPNPWGLPGTEWPGNASHHPHPSPSPTPPPVITGGNDGPSASPAEGEDGNDDHPLGGGASSSSSASSSPSVPAGRPGGTSKSYTVVSGDWLIKIAERHYGDWTKWVDIYNANRSVIGANPDLILPGQVLVLP